MIRLEWPTDLRYFRHFRGLVLILSVLLTADQLYFWSWTLEGDFNPISIFSWLPRGLLESRPFAYTLSVLFLIFSILWHQGWKPKTSSLLSALSFGLASTLYLQNLPFGDHRQSVFFILLVLLALHEFFLPSKALFVLTGLATCSLYFSAGIEKLTHSGLDWANGTSLQIFAHHLGRPDSLLREVLLENVTLSRALQWGVLILELGIFGLFLKGPIRWILLAGLFLFHVGIEEVFFYRFFPIYLVIFYLFGLPDLLRRIYAHRK